TRARVMSIARSRLLIVIAGLAAALFLGWPTFSIDRAGEWRTVLAGFQLQRETGDFIGASSSLIHFHGLDARTGHIRFSLAPRVDGETPEIEVTWPDGSRHLALGPTPVLVDVPFDGTRDLEIHLTATAASNPRPIRLSGLRVTREGSLRTIALSLLPLLIGLVVLTLLQNEGGVAIYAALFATAATTGASISALDPIRALSFTAQWTDALPVAFALGFAAVGVFGKTRTSVAIALLGATLSLHIHTVHSGFVYDDRLWSRPWTLGEIASTFAGSEDPRGISGEQYRPIPSITHATDHLLWGSSPGAFHVVNMAMHTLSAYLLFVFLQRLRLPRSASLLGALTLAIHPLAASSIGWISERTDTLADIFILSTLIVFLGPYGTQTLRVLGVALLALWSKETSVMLPALAMIVSIVALDHEERRARFATIRALIAFVVLYIVVWISLFPEKAAGRALATADTLQSTHAGWITLFGNLFSQLFHPIGFETWRATQDSLPAAGWVAAAVLVGIGSIAMSFVDRQRSAAWRLVAIGLAFSALVVLPFRGHDAVDIYRLGHTPTLGFGILIAAVASLAMRDSRLRTLVLATLLILRLGPVAQETSAAWGYPGFQFRMALRFNLENPLFLSGLTPEMRLDLERQSRFEAHRDNPLTSPFAP
ncbi:MAG: hypothetical protein ABI672_06525, partial [Vicinamibacteria bacterium]